MARIRAIKPAFFTSPTIASLPYTARLTFIGLWTYVDDEGRGRDDTRLIKAELWPLDDKHNRSKVSADLDAIEQAKLIERYTVAGKPYLRIGSWLEHQKINRPQTSKLPAPTPPNTTSFTEPSVNGHGALTEPSRQEGKGSGRDQGSGREEDLEGKRVTSPDTYNTPAPQASPENAPHKTQDQRVFAWTDTAMDLFGFPTSKFTPTQRVMRLACAKLDDRLIDECLHHCATRSDKPRAPKYLHTALHQWAKQHGILITPPLEAAS